MTIEIPVVSAAPSRSHLEQYQRILRGNDGRSRHSTAAGPSHRQSQGGGGGIMSVFGNDFGTKCLVDSACIRLPRGGAAAAAAAAAPGYRTAPQPVGQQPGSASSSSAQRHSPSSTSDRAATKEKIDSFLTRESRQTFITRVYAILSAQLAVTALSVFWFGTHPEWARSMMQSSGRVVPMLSLAISTISAMWISISPSARRSSPLKWQLLALFTIGEAISVGFISSFYQLKSVVSAMSATAAATLSVTMYSFLNQNPKYDLSQWGQGLASLATIFIIYGLINLFAPAGFLPFTEGVYSFFGAALFSAFLAYDTRLIVGGKHSKYQMNEKDYVWGAMSIYMDVINIFIYLLRLIGDDRE
jgi:FtsH-binding integral membrane protein